MVHWWILGAGLPIDTGDHGGCWYGHLKETPARRFGAAGSSPDFSRGFSRHGAPRPLSWTFFQCTLLSYPGQASYSHQQNDWTCQCCVAYMYALFVLAPLAFARGALASMQCMTNLQQVKKHVPEQESSKYLTLLSGWCQTLTCWLTCKIRMCACKIVAPMVKCLTVSLPGDFCSRNPKGRGYCPPPPPTL